MSQDGLVMEASQPIFGRISMLSKVRPFGSSTDHLFIGTNRFQYFTIAWDPETRKLETVNKFEDASEKQVRDTQSRDLCLVDPSGRYFALELFEGVINFIRIKQPRKGGPTNYMDKPEQIRITELKVRASTFLYTELKQPKIAFLFDKGRDDIRLATYRIVDDKMQISSFDPVKDREDDIGGLDVGANMLIPVPKGDTPTKRYIVRQTAGVAAPKAHLGGVIVIGETKFTYFDDESKATVECLLDEASIYSAWERFNDTQYLLADIFGTLSLLTIVVEQDEVINLHLVKVGKTSPATVMVHMGDGILFVGSHEGDSQLVQLDLTPGNETLKVLQTLENIAPIMDFAVMDMGGRDGETQSNEYSSGQARLVTGSGAFEAGSLRSVRSGVGLGDLGILADMEDIRGVFTLRSNEESKDDILAVSLPIETRIFTFDTDGEIEEVEDLRGLAMNHPTHLLKNLPGGLILQITEVGTTVLGPGPSFTVAHWLPPPGQLITAAAANENFVLLSVNGKTLISLSINQGLKEVAVQGAGDDNQIACIHIPEDIPGVGVVGFWKSGSISILKLTNLEIVHSENLRRRNTASIPRDIAMAQLLPTSLSGPTLFIAMEDGVVLTFTVDTSDFSLSDSKSIVLGMHQARFSILPRKNGLSNIFATCEHPSLIYGAEGRIVYSAVTADDAICVCPFDSEAFPDSIVVATDENVKISQIDTERRTHVSTLPIGATVRRIAYSPHERAFGLGCVKRGIFDGEEIINSTFSLVEDVSFGQLCPPVELNSENGTELIECIVRAQLPTAHGEHEPAERFILGTSFLDEETCAPDIKGRILVFGIDNNRAPYLILSHELKSACRKIAIMDGKILAALNKTLVLYDYLEDTEASAVLTKLATYRTATCPIDLAVHGNIIAVSDLMKSVSLVEYTKGDKGLPDKLEEVARHPLAVWSTAVSHIEDGSYLESDQDGNLIILQRNVDGVTLEDKKRLEVTSEMNLGEMVNRIQKIEVEPTASAMVNPKAFLATVSQVYLPLFLVKAKLDSVLTVKKSRPKVRFTSLLLSSPKPKTYFSASKIAFWERFPVSAEFSSTLTVHSRIMFA